MINSIYKYDEQSNVFYIQFCNTILLWPDYKEVNATVHLENAIKKYINVSSQKQDNKVYTCKVATKDITFNIKVTDSDNDYLKIVAMSFIQFIKGLGVQSTNIVRIGF